MSPIWGRSGNEGLGREEELKNGLFLPQFYHYQQWYFHCFHLSSEDNGIFSAYLLLLMWGLNNRSESILKSINSFLKVPQHFYIRVFLAFNMKYLSHFKKKWFRDFLPNYCDSNQMCDYLMPMFVILEKFLWKIHGWLSIECKWSMSWSWQILYGLNILSPHIMP